MRTNLIWRCLAAHILAGAVPASLHGQVAAVDWGGAYTSVNINATVPSRVATGDYDFDGQADDRARIVDFESLFTPSTSANYNVPMGKTGRLYYGAQIAAYNSDIDPSFQLVRLNSGTVLQVGTALTSGTELGLVSAFYAAKADFLNGASEVADLRLSDSADSLSLSNNSSGSPLAGAPVPGRATRFLVRAGAQWYISQSYLAGTGRFSINGAKESWYHYDPSDNQFLHLAQLGGSVPGASLTNITAMGVYTQHALVSGDTTNAALHAVSGFSAKLEPAPPPVVIMTSTETPPHGTKLQWSGGDGVPYDVEYSTDLRHWTTVDTVFGAGDSSTWSETDAERQSRAAAFYRLRISDVAGDLTDDDIARNREAAQQRAEGFFAAQAGQPFSPSAIIVDWNSRGDFTRYYNQDVVMFAMKVFHLNEESNFAQANTALRDMCQYHLDRPQTLLEIHSFHWIGDVLVRLVEYYGPNGTIAPNRLTDETYAKILETMWAWSKVKSRLVDTDVTKTWQIPDSENHHTQEFTVCWAFAMILKDAPAYQGLLYDDGHSAAEHYAAWTLYAEEYLRQRARKGMLVEIDSPSYATGSLTGIYLLFDFSHDPVLKQRAGAFLNLYWALWAEQQFDGVDGGAKARCYPDSAKSGDDFSRRAAWYLCGGSASQYIQEQMLPFVTTTWQMSDVVLDMATAARGKAVYELRQRRMGLALAGFNTGDPYSSLRTDFGGILRYSYCTPDFIMSSLQTEARPASDWANISAQNRWSGVVFPDTLNARIYPCAFKNSDDTSSVYNGFWSVQAGGTLITQKLATSQNADAWRVWVSKSGLSLPQREGNWVFVESGRAVAGICVVRGDFAIDDDLKSTLGRWITCTDSTTPVIIEVARKSDGLTLDSFKAALLAQPPVTMVGQVLSYNGLGGHGFTFYADQSRSPKIDGEPLNYAPTQVYDSPFVQSEWDSGVVKLHKGDREQTLDFN